MKTKADEACSRAVELIEEHLGGWSIGNVENAPILAELGKAAAALKQAEATAALVDTNLAQAEATVEIARVILGCAKLLFAKVDKR